MSQTGANADEWVPIKPGTEGVLALGLAHVIIKSGLRPASAAGRAGGLIDGWSSGLANYAPAQVEQITGIKADRIERLAREFAQHGPAVAIIGGAPLAHTNGMFHAVAVNALNALVGSVGQPGGIFFTPQPAYASASKAPAASAI
jgi:anaerobic selenocysteine-containing dehydrogenase